jgi:hypothetical protein
MGHWANAVYVSYVGIMSYSVEEIQNLITVLIRRLYFFIFICCDVGMLA